MNKYAYTLLGFIKMATQTDGSAAGYAMPNDIPQITLDDIMGVTEDDMKKHYKSTMADNVQSIRDRFMTAAAGKNIDLGPDEEAKFQNWYNWASNSPDYETKVHQPLTKIKPTGSAALAAGSTASPGQPNRVGYWGANPNLAARQALLQAAGPGTQGIDSQIKAESSRFNPGIPMDAPITRADLRIVDKQMMDKYKSLTGAGNPNSDMDRWKTLMAMTNRPASEYSNKAYKKWLAGQSSPNPISEPNPVAGNNNPFTMDDLRKVDKKMMDKYKSLTGAGNPNSDMDRWKTLMAARHGKKWNMYSNDEYKKWRSGIAPTAPSSDNNDAFERQVANYARQAAAIQQAAAARQAAAPAPSPAAAPSTSPTAGPRQGAGSLLMLGGRPQQQRGFASGFKPNFNIRGGGNPF